jgi:hypothetical protein
MERSEIRAHPIRITNPGLRSVPSGLRSSSHDVNFGSPNEKEPSGRSPGGSFPQLPDRVRFHRYDFGEAVKVRAVFAGL